MKPEQRYLVAILFAISGVTFGLTRAYPSCDDSTIKTILLLSTLYGQWCLAGFIIGASGIRQPYRTVGYCILIGVPLMTCVWVWSLWPFWEFGGSWDLIFRTLLSVFVIAPVALLATFFGDRMKDKMSLTRRWSQFR